MCGRVKTQPSNTTFKFVTFSGRFRIHYAAYL